MGIKFREEKKPYQPLKPVITIHKPPDISPKRGPKPSGKAKTLISIRLDQDVINGFKLTGKGWQGRMNASLRKALNLTDP